MKIIHLVTLTKSVQTHANRKTSGTRNFERDTHMQGLRTDAHRPTPDDTITAKTPCEARRNNGACKQTEQNGSTFSTAKRVVVDGWGGRNAWVVSCDVCIICARGPMVRMEVLVKGTKNGQWSGASKTPLVLLRFVSLLFKPYRSRSRVHFIIVVFFSCWGSC